MVKESLIFAVGIACGLLMMWVWKEYDVYTVYASAYEARMEDLISNITPLSVADLE